MEPVRTCIGCRSRAPRSSLVRTVVSDGRVVCDTTASLPGRGAWLHPSEACLDRAVKRRAFGRALRASEIYEVTAIRAALREQAKEAVTSHE